MLERLHKVLARAGVAALRPAEDMILAGRVTVNGRVVRELGARADPDVDRIAVDGQAVTVPDPGDPHRYIMLNKPPGVISTAADTEGRPTVVQLVPGDVRLFPVGRLDADSEGLILLTDDGDLAYRLTHPRFGVEKEYRVLLDHQMHVDAIRQWRNGVTLPDGELTAPAWVERLEPGDGGDWLRVVLSEGKKREIREVARLLGYDVRRLIRVREGSLQLGDLPPGHWRPLATTEVELLRRHTQHVPSREADEARESVMADRDRGPRRLRIVRGAQRPTSAEPSADTTEPTQDGASETNAPSDSPPRTRFDAQSRSDSADRAPTGERRPGPDRRAEPGNQRPTAPSSRNPSDRGGSASAGDAGNERFEPPAPQVNERDPNWRDPDEERGFGRRPLSGRQLDQAHSGASRGSSGRSTGSRFGQQGRQNTPTGRSSTGGRPSGPRRDAPRDSGANRGMGYSANRPSGERRDSGRDSGANRGMGYSANRPSGERRDSGRDSGANRGMGYSANRPSGERRDSGRDSGANRGMGYSANRPSGERRDSGRDSGANRGMGYSANRPSGERRDSGRDSGANRGMGYSADRSPRDGGNRGFGSNRGMGYNPNRERGQGGGYEQRGDGRTNRNQGGNYDQRGDGRDADAQRTGAPPRWSNEQAPRDRFNRGRDEDTRPPRFGPRAPQRGGFGRPPTGPATRGRPSTVPGDRGRWEASDDGRQGQSNERGPDRNRPPSRFASQPRTGPAPTRGRSPMRKGPPVRRKKKDD